jgi:hypothetical protein
MIAVKAFLEGIEGARPDVAEDHAQRGDGQSHGPHRIRIGVGGTGSGTEAI